MDNKIRVEFELSPEDAKDLLEFGIDAPEVISDKELHELASKGAIRAADYLDEADIEALLKLPKKVKKVASKVGKKVAKRVTPTIVWIAGEIIVDTVSSGLESPEESGPKE